MSLVLLNALAKSFGGQPILEPTSLEINAGRHLGLVGRNGIGKTTLLKMISGAENPTSGHVVRQPGIRIGYLAQDPHYAEGRSLYAEVREGLAALDRIEEELRHLEERLADPQLANNESEYQEVMERYGRLHDLYDNRDGWRADNRVEAILDGLNVPRVDWERDASTFSGGERNVIGLARLLVQDPDLMLLDEPGNHLDFEGLDWLEDVLNATSNAFILVSHNRYLLDATCKGIWEMEHQVISEYAGNYSAYRAEKLTRMEKLESAAKRQEKEVDRLQFQIRRLKSWASVYDNPGLAKKAKSLERRIDRMDKVEKLREDRRKIGIQFGDTRTKGDIALDVVDYTRGYGDGPALLQNVTFRIGQGEFIALVGANGTGKSTLFKDIVKEGRWENPNLRVGKAMKVGYFAQMAEPLDTSNLLIDEMMRLSGLRRNDAESLAHRFLFSHEDLEKPVSVLSGGEKARVQLAGLMASGANFLLLDEPTNHLDLFSREAVEDALEQFQGTIFVISHDRYFLDKLTDRILHLVPPDITPFEGNFSDFWTSLKEKRTQREEEEQTQRKADKAARAGKAPKKRKVKFDAQRFAELEAEIARLEEQQERLESEIAVEHEKGNTKREEAKRVKLTETEEQLENAYEEWFVLGDKKIKTGG